MLCSKVKLQAITSLSPRTEGVKSVLFVSDLTSSFQDTVFKFCVMVILVKVTPNLKISKNFI